MQEAIWYTTGKPDDVGVGGDNRIHVHWEAGVGRGPKCVHMGKPDRAGGPVTNTR